MTAEAEKALKALLASDDLVCAPTDVAPILKCKPYTLTCMAQDGMLGIPHTLIGRNLRIFRVPFLRSIGYDVSAPFDPNAEEEE